MAPQRYASVRSVNKPASSLVPFRDDSLLSLRYDQTVQAEPPIPIPPPRSPLRVTRSIRTISSISTFSIDPPIIISPPRPRPPKEQHPALRTITTRRSFIDDYCSKRDSGAPTSASDTLYEISEGEDVSHRNEKFDLLPELLKTVPKEHQVRRERTRPPPPPPPTASSAIGDERELSHAQSQCPGSSQTDCAPEITKAHARAPSSIRSTRSKRFVRSLSIRSAAGATMKRLRKKSLSEQDAPVGDATVPEAAANGSLESPLAAPSQISLRSPGFPESPKIKSLSVLSSGAGSSTADLGGGDFSPITTSIPTDSLLEDDFMTQLSFSKRGSIMFGGRRPRRKSQNMNDNDTTSDPFLTQPSMEDSQFDGTVDKRPLSREAVTQPSSGAHDAATSPAPSQSMDLPDDDANTTLQAPAPASPRKPPSIRVTSVDVEKESQKVRSLYESGEGLDWREGGRVSSFCEPIEDVPSADDGHDVLSELNHARISTPTIGTQRSGTSLSWRPDSFALRDYELAGGGIEDWQGLDGGDVDRYGFISVRRPGTTASAQSDLKPVQYSPRKQRNVLVRKDHSTAPPSSLGPRLGPSKKMSARSLNTQTSELSTSSRRSTRSAVRAAANLLPHNHDRRWVDLAGDMLTLPPGLATSIEDEKVERIAESLKRKEWERSEKWMKMAKVVKPGKDGEGMVFEFDPKHPKLIERTWKGIPDRWRAAAWYSFLSSSAKSSKQSLPAEDDLIAEFHRLQNHASPDDGQIDLDVPRTINQHIMFRRRYRGGQRLLFRVLHALSIYFPETGYVQGMASLAASLLNYYDEEKCFVMLVRLWKLRGLNRLYQPGFAELMGALQDFEKYWLGQKDVALKLAELSIDPTAYATRWYLTLFNLSVPFPAQLRIWDVFMLLGGSPSVSPEGTTNTEEVSSKGLEILHATSAALIHALREVLLDSDFENAMKALTSWIPIKDEELLMKVVRTEYKQRAGKKKA